MPNRISHATSSVFAWVRAGALPLLCVAGLALAPAADARNQRQTVIRDAEIEALLRDYAEPIFAAAGVSSRDADIVLVLNKEFNAFVASGRRIVVHTGTLLEAETPNEVIGVLAHETGHLAGGHLEGLRNEVARAQAIGAVVSLLGMAGVVAGATSGATSGAKMGTAFATMGPGIAERSLLSYRRTQELAADRAALSYLNATHQSAKGMVKTFERFADQQLFSARYADPYAQTHPMARDRLQQLQNAAQETPYWDAVDSDRLQLRHDMMRAKLSGFSESPSMVGRRYPRSDDSMPAQYARAIVAYRTGGTREAVRAIDALIQRVPNYPYFHELKGQALLEAGHASEAIAPLRQAVALAPEAGLIRIMLGHALLQTGNDAQLDDAVANLIHGLGSEPLASDGYRHLATAYHRQGKVAEAELATAEGLLIDGDIDSAKVFAQRAQAKFSRGSPGWLKADDIISYEDPNGSKH
jgi:predicted Zn-dependent protease